MNTLTRSAMFLVIAATLFTTRAHLIPSIHFDMTWVSLFLAGFITAPSLASIKDSPGIIRAWALFQITILLSLGVAADYIVITKVPGVSFWTHYCVSPAYYVLQAAYTTLFAGGILTAHIRDTKNFTFPTAFNQTFIITATIFLAYTISNQSFYWLSPIVTNPTVSGAATNFLHWFLQYFTVNTLILTPLVLATHAITSLVKQRNTDQTLYQNLWP